MSGMVYRSIDTSMFSGGMNASLGAGLEPEAMHRNGQLPRDLLLQHGQAQVDSKLLPANSFKAQIRLRQSSYQQNLFSHLFPILLFQPMSSTNGAQLQKMESCNLQCMLNPTAKNYDVSDSQIFGSGVQKKYGKSPQIWGSHVECIPIFEGQ